MDLGAFSLTITFGSTIRVGGTTLPDRFEAFTRERHSVVVVAVEQVGSALCMHEGIDASGGRDIDLV
jgi:hypothetical protein